MRKKFIKYLYYELLSIYYEEIADEEKDEHYVDKTDDIWLTDEEVELLNGRGMIKDMQDLINANNIILEKEKDHD